MGNRRIRWTKEEEEALKAGVAKHGAGQWKLIQTDPDFHQFLLSRSNIDLKDKWRNMGFADQRRRYREMLRSRKPKSIQDASASSGNIQTAPVTPAPVVPLVIHEQTSVPVKEKVLRFNDLIFEALASVKSGMGIGSIMRYIENRVIIENRQNFRKGLGTRLKRLVAQERLKKVRNLYRIKNMSLVQRKRILPRQLQSSYCSESVEEAAKTAAFKVAEAEEKKFQAELSAMNANRIMEMAEEADNFLQIAIWIRGRCNNSSGVPVTRALASLSVA